MALGLRSMGDIMYTAMREAMALAEYGYKPLTMGYYEGKAFVRLWNWRKGHMEWRRFPQRDVPKGQEPVPTYNPFWFFDKRFFDTPSFIRETRRQ